jgi:hypothetical protein
MKVTSINDGSIKLYKKTSDPDHPYRIVKSRGNLCEVEAKRRQSSTEMARSGREAAHLIGAALNRHRKHDDSIRFGFVLRIKHRKASIAVTSLTSTYLTGLETGEPTESAVLYHTPECDLECSEDRIRFANELLYVIRHCSVEFKQLRQTTLERLAKKARTSESQDL